MSEIASAELAAVAAALRDVTEDVGRRLAEPGNEPRWSELEWRIAEAVCGLHGVAALLQEGFRGRGPARFRDFLEAQSGHALARHARIAALLGALDREACAAGVPLVALKGAALYARGLYGPGLRPMGDIDLLVRESQRPALEPVLAACGYEAAYSSRRHDVFHPLGGPQTCTHRLGEHIDNPIKIEIHTRISEPLPVTKVDITALVMPVDAQPGINGYPSGAALLGHLALHAAGNMRARALRLVQLHDIALLARTLTPAAWIEALGNGSLGWWALPPLRLTARYYRGVIPESIEARLAGLCPPLLRAHSARARVCDVSWSRLGIQAFPGIEWSRTPAEACRHMLARMVPSRVALRELERGAAQIPAAGEVPWYGLSHVSRIVRWIFGRPPRVQTLLSVRAALEGLNVLHARNFGANASSHSQRDDDKCVQRF
ncbi:MAG TPA: nucleotidyltransferase family protein [Steroidobacteraceae bacterium]|jgi:hypothetical protein|nr:nucleotidyltransferase family protein [Steroidobacteraceae bacterium]